jgi:hypothetical protein
MRLRIAGDPDRARPLRVFCEQWQQLAGRGILAHRALDVAPDQEQIVGTALGDAGQEQVEVSTVADHPRRHVHRNGMTQLT